MGSPQDSQIPNSPFSIRSADSMDLPSESAVPIFNMPQYFPMMFQVSLVRFIHGPIGRGLDFRAGKLSLDGFMKAVKGSFKHFPEVTQCFLV